MSIEEVIGHHFSQRRLLEEALTHPGCAQTHKDIPFNYQRLEFLGDSVLGMIVAEIVYHLYPQENEGNLAKRHAALVRGESLVKVARLLGLSRYINVPAGIDDAGRDNPSNLEDVCEALIGALYLDGGMDAARKFVRQHWLPLARNVQAAPKDAKTALQEWAQARGLPLPVYVVQSITGPAHAPEFEVEVRIEVEGGQARARATAKRQAEQLAAQAMLERL